MKKVLAILAIMLLIVSGCSFAQTEKLKASLGEGLELRVKRIEFAENYFDINVEENEMLMMIFADVENEIDKFTSDKELRYIANIGKEQYDNELIYQVNPDANRVFLEGVSEYIIIFKLPTMKKIKNVKIDIKNIGNNEEIDYLEIINQKIEIVDMSPTLDGNAGAYSGIEVNLGAAEYISREDAEAIHPDLVNDFFKTEYFLVDIEIRNNTVNDIVDVGYSLATSSDFDRGTIIYNGAWTSTELLEEYRMTDEILVTELISAHSTSKGKALFQFDNKTSIDFDDLYLYVRPFQGDLEQIKIKLEM